MQCVILQLNGSLHQAKMKRCARKEAVAVAKLRALADKTKSASFFRNSLHFFFFLLTLIMSCFFPYTTVLAYTACDHDNKIIIYLQLLYLITVFIIISYQIC